MIKYFKRIDGSNKLWLKVEISPARESMNLARERKMRGYIWRKWPVMKICTIGASTQLNINNEIARATKCNDRRD